VVLFHFLTSTFFHDAATLQRWRRTFGRLHLRATPPLRLSNAIYRFFLDRPVSSSGVPFDSCERSSRAFAVCSLPARLSFWATLLKQLPVLASIVTQSRRQICGRTRFSLLARAHPWHLEAFGQSEP
jgi:hypothetical protein